MKRIKNLSMIFALVLGAAATGCAVDPVDVEVDDGDGGEDGGGGDEGGGEEQRPLDAAGTYRLQSNFDIASGIPGTAGTVVSTIIDLTDAPEDPTLWVVDRLLAAMPSGWAKTALQNAKPYVVGYLNDRILDLAPDFVSVAVQLGNNLGQMAKGFGLNETLEVTGAPGAYASKVSAVGAHFSVDGVESDHGFADHGAPVAVADAVAVTLDSGKLGIGEHRIAVSYGQVLRLGLDAAIIPMLEPDARSLNELFAAKVNCDAIAETIADYVPFADASDFANPCKNGLNAGANYIYSKLSAIDGVALELAMTGEARALDTDKDRSIDTLNTGTWTGTVRFGGAGTAPLAAATFFGERM